MSRPARMGLRVTAVAALLAVAVLIGPVQAPAGAQLEAAVNIQGFAFTPADLTVSAGTTVRWTQSDSALHTVTSSVPDAANAGAVFRSESLGAGEAFSFTFSESGVFPYFCEIHPRMRGMVTVTGEAPAAGGEPEPELQPAPGPSTQIEAPATAIVARDFSFSAPAAISQGLNKLTLTNEGQEPHHAQLLRLNDGVTAEQFGAAAQQGPGPLFTLVTFRGGPGAIDPGGEQVVWVDLPVGSYLMICSIASPDGLSHAAKGMTQPLQVSPAAISAAPPQSSAEVEMGDFGFDLPDLRAGTQVIMLTNTGAQAHEMTLIKLAAGAGAADTLAFFAAPAGPPPFSSAGGFQAVGPGLSGWAQIDLSAGSYLAICSVPDPDSGRPHYELGMVSSFAVP